MSHSARAILFSFDFALADSSRVSAACINRALTALDLPRVSMRQASGTVNLSLDETYHAITGRSIPGEARTFKKVFRECALEVMVPLTDVFPYVLDMALALKERDIKLAIVTRKERDLVLGVLQEAELSGIFDVIVGRDELDRPKPDPTGILVAMERLGVDAVDTIFVGDSTVDAEASQAAGVRFVGVLTGTTPEDDLVAYQPEAILHSVADLPAWLDCSLS